MRVHLSIQASNKVIPYDHQSLLVGTIHKWLGWNDKHGKMALYSFSRLEGCKSEKEGLKFDDKGSLYFSSHDPDLIKRIIFGIKSDPTIFCGLAVCEILIQEDPDFSQRELFFTGSPVFIKRLFDNKTDHILYNDPRAEECLKETLKRKMNLVGLTDDQFNISFDTSYRKAGTKMVNYHGVQNKASWCPVIITGKHDTKLFAWNVGVGNSTGIGFGAIK